MKKLKNITNLGYEDWLEERRKGIGGSDAAAIAGLNPFKSPISVYLEKTEKSIEKIDNERMRIGRDLEDYVAKRFEEATGEKVRRNNYILAHDEYDYITANIDRELVGKNEGLECKTTNSYAIKEWEDDKIPPHYEIQCHHYMLVTGYEGWYIAVLIGNEKFIYKYIKRDEEIINYLLKIEKEFWEENIMKNIAPPPDGSKASEHIIKKLYPEATESTEIDLNQFSNDISRLDEIQALKDELGREEENIKQNIQMEMKENERGYCKDRIITWKNIETNRIDSKKLKSIYPDIAQEVTKTTTSRRFLIK